MYFDQCVDFLARMIEKYGDQIKLLICQNKSLIIIQLLTMTKRIRLLPNIHKGAARMNRRPPLLLIFYRLFVIIFGFAIDGRVVIIVKCSWDNYFDCNCLVWPKQL